MTEKNGFVVFGLDDTGFTGPDSVAIAVEAMLEEIDITEAVHTAEHFGKEQLGKLRPIRVTYKDSSAVQETLRAAKKLKSTAFKDVYISMDRTPEQQKYHKDLVIELKKNIKSSPDRYWYIRNDKIYSNVKDL